VRGGDSDGADGERRRLEHVGPVAAPRRARRGHWHVAHEHPSEDQGRAGQPRLPHESPGQERHAAGQKHCGRDTRDGEPGGGIGGPWRRPRDDVMAEENIFDAVAQERDAEDLPAEPDVVELVQCAHGARL
jgi:hypothetical protein